YARLLDAWLNDGKVSDRQWISREGIEQALIPRSTMPYASQVPGCVVRYGQKISPGAPQQFIRIENRPNEEYIVG
ncbi:hypothetical protein ACFL39_02450, partial [Gemmatimonadota bacterium]